jgi:GT2 family glycosyltransferase
MKPEPAITVVIPTCDRPELLRACLGALASAVARVPDACVEVIVTDDSTGDASQHLVLAEYPWASWTRGPRRGPAANRNHGARSARGRWLVFTDDDCVADPEWLAALLDRMGRMPTCSVLEGKTVADRERRRLDEESPENPRGGYLWSCNMAIRRGLFERLDGFSETFPYAAMEDVDLRLRILAAGEVFEFVPSAIVCHPFRPAKGLSFARRSGSSFVHLVERHPELLGPRPWRATALNTMHYVTQLLAAGFRYRFRGFGYAAVSQAVRVYFEVVACMRSVRQRRLTGAAAAIDD